MPKVLRIINRLNLGGPTYNAAYLSKYLAPEFETLLVSGMKDETEESSEFIIKNLDLHPVYVSDMYRNIHPFRDYNSYYKLRKIIEEYKPDIVHTHAAKAGSLGRLAASHSGVPVILHTFHGHVFHSYFNRMKTRVFLEIERYLARRTTKIIALSPIQKDELCNTYRIAPPEKFAIIPLGFDLEKFDTDKEAKRKKFRNQYHIADDEIAIGIIGRLAPIKNHAFFLRAIKSVAERTTKKIRVFIIGDGEERNRIKQYALSLGLPFNNQNPNENRLLTFTSWIKDIDVSNAGLDIIALTSKNEGTPVSLIEALASGKPVVSTNVGGIENIIVNEETGLLSPPEDETMFTKNLLRLIEEEGLRNNLSQHSHEFVISRFGHQRLCSDMSGLYHRLLKDNLRR